MRDIMDKSEVVLGPKYTRKMSNELTDITVPDTVLYSNVNLGYAESSQEINGTAGKLLN